MMCNEKKEKEFLEKEVSTFNFGCQLFGPGFRAYSFFFMDHKKNFDVIKNLAKLQNFQVKQDSVIKINDTPFGFDQFILLAPFIRLPSKLLEIIYGENEQFNCYLENYYKDGSNENKEFMSKNDIRELANFINDF